MTLFRFLACITLGILLSGFPVVADEPVKKDPIDIEVDKMMDKDPSTAGMLKATTRGTELWDAAMNKAYIELMKKLPEAERASLKKSQVAWLGYRDANSQLVSAVYGHAQGTMYGPMSANEVLELVKERTLLLRGYLDILGQNGDDSGK